VAFTQANGGGPDDWEVVEGGKYTMTITGVTECDGDTITVFVQGTSTGNFCFNATGGGGIYTCTFTMPNPACHTYPISYKCSANQPCNNSNTFNARGPSGANSVHLRASKFDESCNRTGDDTICSCGTPVFENCPTDGGDRGCNPESEPVGDPTVKAKDTCGN